MAIDMAELRSIARGDFTVKCGVAGVATSQHVAATSSATCVSHCSYASNASYVLKHSKKENREKGGVATGVANSNAVLINDPAAHQAEASQRNQKAALSRLTDRWCACGKLATLAVGRFKGSMDNPEGVARWLCNECFEDGRNRTASNSIHGY